MNSTNIFLSFEMLYLMKWLLKNDRPAIKMLFQRAIDNGFALELEKVSINEQQNLSDSLNSSFNEFIDYMEDCLVSSLLDNYKNKNIQNFVISSLQKLNINRVDSQALLASMKQIEDEVSREDRPLSKDEAKRLFLEKMLKNWNPNKEDEVN